MLQDMMNYWMSQGNPDDANFVSLKNNILSNFLNQNQTNAGDSLSSNYPWMPSMSGAASAMAPMMNSQAAQTPFGQMLGQMGANSGDNLRTQLFRANQMIADYNKSKIPPVDQTVRGMPTKDAGARDAARAFYSKLDQINHANDYGSMNYDVSAKDLADRIRGTMNNMYALQPGGGGWNSNGMIPMAQDFLSRFGN
jgi:hypothetical protein